MQRRDIINELLERLEAELDELSTHDLSIIINEYEHSPMLSSLIDELNLGNDEEENDCEELSEIDTDEWQEE